MPPQPTGSDREDPLQDLDDMHHNTTTKLSFITGTSSSSSRSSTSGSLSPTPFLRIYPHISTTTTTTTTTATTTTSSSLPLGPCDFTLVRPLGSGDLSIVYLCRLASDPLRLFAMKIVDKREATRKNKNGRFDTELRVLRLLHHPFLPSLRASFDASPHHSCAVIDFCSAGDLHSLRHRQPSRRFRAPSARFYAAEVLAALEYLHLLGVVYRDLKPENVLLRSDGHIMLSDFDLALLSTTYPEVDDPSTATGCWGVHTVGRRRRRRRVVAEPVAARSASFVGTHEYVAPEVAGGGTHGAEVDWWALGVLLYELIYGRTPFVGLTNEATLRNIVKSSLAFPDNGGGVAGRLEQPARDLIGKLLDKEPRRRLGSGGGAADVKAHPFFRGVNFALLRSVRPPVVPTGSSRPDGRRRNDHEKLFECF